MYRVLAIRSKFEQNNLSLVRLTKCGHFVLNVTDNLLDGQNTSRPLELVAKTKTGKKQIQCA